MKLKNKETGEIIEPCEIYCDTQDKICVRRPGENFGAYIEYEYNSLAELNSEWEDAPEEPKEYWYMDYGGRIKVINDANDEEDVARKEIGNYFETEEEAEKAVEKLRAFKRLKDKGFRFTGVEEVERVIRFEMPFRAGYDSCEAEADLNICFGGEE